MLGQYGRPGSQFRWRYSNWDVPAATPGTAVVSGKSNAEGAWTRVATSANIANDVYLFYINVGDSSTDAQNVNGCLDVGVDPAGGTSYTEVIQNAIIGKGRSIAYPGGPFYLFPLFIKAGSSVAVRWSSSYGTNVTAQVLCTFYGRPRRPEQVRVGQYSEGIGTITNNVGVSFTPGNAAEGDWTSLGTTTLPLWWLQLGVDINSDTIAAQYTNVDLAVGDGSNYDIIMENFTCNSPGTTEYLFHAVQPNIIEGYWEVPAGSTLYVRGYCNTAPTDAYNARVIGIGG